MAINFPSSPANGQLHTEGGVTWTFVSAKGVWQVTMVGTIPVHSHPESDIINLVADLAGKAALSHTHAATSISDSTAAGRAMLLASNAAAQKTLLGISSSIGINVEEHGAVGNGTADDRTAFVNANAAAVTNKGYIQLLGKTYGIAAGFQFDVPVLGPGDNVCSIKAIAAIAGAMVITHNNGLSFEGFKVDGNDLADHGMQPSSSNGSRYRLAIENCKISGFFGGTDGNNNNLSFHQARLINNGTIWNCGTSYTQGAIQNSSASTVSGSGNTLTITGPLDPTTLGLRLDIDIVKVTGHDPFIITAVSSNTISVYPAIIGTITNATFAVLKGNGCEVTRHSDNNVWVFHNCNFSINAGAGIRDNSLYGAIDIASVHDNNTAYDRITGQRTGAGGGPTYGAASIMSYNEGGANKAEWHLLSTHGVVINPQIPGTFAEHVFDNASTVMVLDGDPVLQSEETINSTTHVITKTVTIFVQSSGAADFVAELPVAPRNAQRPENYVLILGAIGGKNCTVKTASAGTLINGVAGTTGVVFSGSNRVLNAYWSDDANGWIVGGTP